MVAVRINPVTCVGDAAPPVHVRYSSYGVPTSYPKGDYDLDGDVDASDTTALGNFIAGAGGWNLDFNRDGNTDADRHHRLP